MDLKIIMKYKDYGENFKDCRQIYYWQKLMDYQSNFDYCKLIGSKDLRIVIYFYLYYNFFDDNMYVWIIIE